MALRYFSEASLQVDIYIVSLVNFDFALNFFLITFVCVCMCVAFGVFDFYNILGTSGQVILEFVPSGNLLLGLTSYLRAIFF